MGVIGLTGSALNSRLAAGIKEVNLNSALSEARSTFFNAQYQMLLARGEMDWQVKTLVNEIVQSATSLGSDQDRRQIVILPSLSNTNKKGSYEIGTSIIDVKSIPLSLREKLKNTQKTFWEYANIRYQTQPPAPALIVGQSIEIPGSGGHQIFLVFSLANQNQTLNLIKNSTVSTGLALIVLIALITWLVVRQVVRPVREASRIAVQFTAGDFSQRMGTESSDEISTLGHAFNDMAQSLETQIRRLENLSRVQQRFVSDVSHELRTPLTTLRMASDVIHGSRANFDPTVARSAELLVAQIDRFEQLLEDLLEISRFDAEVAALEVVEFDLVRLVLKSIEDLAMMAQEKESIISIKEGPSHVLIKADARRVERILRNLLSNAIDHAEGKPIDIVIRESETEVAVGVRDYGVGLDEKVLIRVFDRFWRADPSRARFRGSTGLGLSIALEDARLHNGELEAWGRPGKGAHFVLTLPRVAGGEIQSRIIRLQPFEDDATF